MEWLVVRFPVVKSISIDIKISEVATRHVCSREEQEQEEVVIKSD